MSTPQERTRAIQKARDFLRRIAQRDNTKGVPTPLREEAYQILGHYPGDYDLYAASKDSDVFVDPESTGMLKTTQKNELDYYVLKINKEQAQALVTACDLFSRIGIGQFEEIISMARFGLIAHKNNDSGDDYERFAEAEHALRETKGLITGMSANENFSIGSDKVNSIFKVTWDLQQVIRQRIAWDGKGNPASREWSGDNSMMFVNYDCPMATSKIPLAKMESARDFELLDDLPEGYAVAKSPFNGERKWSLFEFINDKPKWLINGESIKSLINYIGSKKQNS